MNRAKHAGRAWFAARVLLATLFIAAHAAGQAASSQAEQLFYDAKGLLESQHYDEACEKLERSQALNPGLGTLALLAYCHEMQGRTATAYAEYNQAVRWAERQGDAERQRVIERQRDRLKPRLSMLRLIVPQPVPGLELERAGEKLEQQEWGLPIPIDPGTVTVRAQAPGYETWTANVQVGSEGARVDVNVPPLARVDEVQPVVPSRLDTPVLVAFGVGAAGLGVGTYFGLRASSLKQDSDDAGCNADSVCNREGYDLRNDARGSARIANIAFGIGLAGVATGVVLMLTRSGSEKPAPSASLRVAPSARGGWASFQHSF
jgi:hypothetical protein